MSGHGRKLTPLQSAAVAYLAEHPDATPYRMCEAAGVRGGYDNWAAFLWRLIDTGRVRVVLVEGPGPEPCPDCPDDAQCLTCGRIAPGVAP